MGNELASFDEWNENVSLCWELKKFPIHDSVSRVIRDLNLIYAHEKSMHIEEHNPERFRWLMVDNNNQSVFAFQRTYKDECLVFVFNMTPNYYDSYDIPILIEGEYEEIFNSDKDVYGGWGQYNGLPLKAMPYGPENKPYHISIKLASLGACIFKLKKEKKVAAKRGARKVKKG